MPIVLDIKEFHEMRLRATAKAAGVLAAANVSHPKIDLATINPSILPGSPTVCADCGHAEFPVLDKNTGLTVRVCRDCINAIREVSCEHNSPNCYRFNPVWDYDEQGMLRGVTAQTLDIQDSTGVGPTGLPVVRLGLLSLIAAGRVSIDITTDRITITRG